MLGTAGTQVGDAAIRVWVWQQGLHCMHRQGGHVTNDKALAHHRITDNQNSHRKTVNPGMQDPALSLSLCLSPGAHCEEGVQGMQLCHLLTVHKACNVPQDDQLFAVAVQAHRYQGAAIW